MADGKISGLMISMVVVSLFVAVIGIFLANVSSEYSVTYDASEFEVYNQINNLTSMTEDVQTSVLGITEKSGVLDVIGAFFSDAYKALKITAKSLNVFKTMAEAGAEDLNLGESAVHFKSAVILVIIITVIIGGLMAALLKWVI